MSKVLEILNLQKSYQRNIRILSDISFTIDTGSITAIIGNSGGGKSTLLRLIAGFEFPDQGMIRKHGILISDPQYVTPPQKRKIGIIFQDYALFPHLSVEKNIRFGLDRKEDQNMPERIMEMLRLNGMRDRYPSELSGGEQQRVAIARSLVARPDILLMDEPFSSIDVINRSSVRSELKELLKKLKTTAILVSHDYRDAMSLANQIIVLRDGKIAQTGSPDQVFNHPTSVFVARLFGPCNEIRGIQKDGGFATDFGTIDLGQTELGKNGSILIRPWEMVISDNGSCSGSIIAKTYIGHVFEYEIESNGSRLLIQDVKGNLELGDKILFDLK